MARTDICACNERTDMREFCHFLGEFARHPLTVFEAVRTSRGEKRPADRPKWTQEVRSSHLGRRIGLLPIDALGTVDRLQMAVSSSNLTIGSALVMDL
jgi:hypothetical protein